MLLADHLRTGEGKQDTTRLNLFESNGIQLPVPLQGIPQYILVFGKSRWIQDDEIVVMSHLFQKLESILRIRRMTCITREVQFHISVRQRNSLGRTIHWMDHFRSAPHGIERKATRITEHIQDRTIFGILLQELAILPLIHEESGLLPLQPVHIKLQSILQCDVFGIPS